MSVARQRIVVALAAACGCGTPPAPRVLAKLEVASRPPDANVVTSTALPRCLPPDGTLSAASYDAQRGDLVVCGSPPAGCVALHAGSTPAFVARPTTIVAATNPVGVSLDTEESPPLFEARVRGNRVVLSNDGTKWVTLAARGQPGFTKRTPARLLWMSRRGDRALLWRSAANPRLVTSSLSIELFDLVDPIAHRVLDSEDGCSQVDSTRPMFGANATETVLWGSWQSSTLVDHLFVDVLHRRFPTFEEPAQPVPSHIDCGTSMGRRRGFLYTSGGDPDLLLGRLAPDLTTRRDARGLTDLATGKLIMRADYSDKGSWWARAQPFDRLPRSAGHEYDLGDGRFVLTTVQPADTTVCIGLMELHAPTATPSQPPLPDKPCVAACK